MLDLAFFRANFDQVAARLSTRGTPLNLDNFRELDRKRRAAITEAEELKAKRNASSAEIAKLRQQGVDTAGRQQEIAGMKERISALDKEVTAADEQFRELLTAVPNLPHESVPVGRSAEENVEVRRCGEPRHFDFTPKAHWDLGPELGILD